MHQHTVEKIGGTSMSRFELLLENIFLRHNGTKIDTINQNNDQAEEAIQKLYSRIFVVSAYGGITDLLLEHKKSGEPGIYQKFAYSDASWESSLNQLTETMININRGFEKIGLPRDKADKFVTERILDIKNCLKHLQKVCTYGHFRIEEFLPTVREMLSSLGEAHSAHNSSLILQSHSLNSVFVDLTGWKEKESLPLDEKIKKSFATIDPGSCIPIATGYTKCQEGLMSQFDRGYSEITFSKIATITKAKEGIIHKEFHLSSADPNLVGKDKVKIIGQTNFDVADQLADLGMEAIHPKASKGMEQCKIPIRVKNSFEPNHQGTIINTNHYKTAQPHVEIIAGRKKMLSLQIHDPDMVGQSGYDYKILSFFSIHNISYVAKNTNANTITHYLPENTPNLEQCVKEIKMSFESAQVTLNPVSIVSVISSNLGSPGYIVQASKILDEAGITILACDQCMRHVNIQFIINQKDYERAIKVLHQNLIEKA